MAHANRPRVAISSCLIGEPVRYDGGHKRHACITDQLSEYFDWFPVCPEVAIGMGVPRPPIQLVEIKGRVHALGVDDPTLDVTDALQDCAQQLLASLTAVSGYIFKSRSPSCGLTDTDLFDAGHRASGITSGVFAARIRVLLPGLPMIDETHLDDPAARDSFIQQVNHYHAAGQGRT